MAPPPPEPSPEKVELAPRASTTPVPARASVRIHTEPPAPPWRVLWPLARIAPSICTRRAAIFTVPPPILSWYEPPPFSRGKYTLPYVSAVGALFNPPSPRWLPPDQLPGVPWPG